MTFALDDRWVWDFWLARSGPEYHLYYLSAPKELGDPNLRHRNATIGHAVSTDLVNWVDRGPVLEPGGDDDFDGTATWTGSVVRGHDGIWRMFYTGADFLVPGATTNIETIGVATSSDLHTWTKRPGPVLEADPRWYEKLADGTWREEAWRDPWVFFDTATEQWHMLITARSTDGDTMDRGVIGHAVSADLDRWEAREPLSAPGAGFMHLEVPQLATIAGRSLLIFSCDTAHLAGRRAADREVGGIWAVAAGSASGPFAAEDAVRLTGEELYSGRIIEDANGHPVLLAFQNVGGGDGEFVGGLSDPIPLGWSPEGTLVAAGAST